jgi:hypothetical protein
MKIIALVSAGLIALAATAPTMANAQDRQAHHEKVVTHTRVVHDNGNRTGSRNHVRRVCRTEWRHHHRVRICRNVRR